MSPLVVMTLCMHVFHAMGNIFPPPPHRRPPYRQYIPMPRPHGLPMPRPLAAPHIIPRMSPPLGPNPNQPQPGKRDAEDDGDLDCDELEKRISALEINGKRQEWRINNLSVHKFAPIAFTAVMSATQNDIHYGKKIIFPNVLLNNGAGYNPKTGVFTAPATGTYLISVHVLHPKMKKSMQLSVVLHDRTIARIHGTAYMWDGGSQTLVININQGQQLWVQNDRNEKIAEVIVGGHFSTFSGVKLN